MNSSIDPMSVSLSLRDAICGLVRVVVIPNNGPATGRRLWRHDNVVVQLRPAELAARITAMSHICESSWLNSYVICKQCGARVSYYACIGSLVVKRPTALDPAQAGSAIRYWVACDNDGCKNHQGEGVNNAERPTWETRR